MNKVELEAKLESLTDEINFLRSIYDEVWEQKVVFLSAFAICILVAGAFLSTCHIRWHSFAGLSLILHFFFVLI